MKTAIAWSLAGLMTSGVWAADAFKFYAESDLYVLAGATEDGRFPPGLNTADPPTALRADETPDGYGFDLSQDGYLARGTCPAGSARIEYTTNISSIAYYWYFNRLWLTNGTTLQYYAPYYDDALPVQGLGKLFFNEDAQNIKALLAVQPDSLLVVKPTGAYVMGNAADTRGFFTRTHIGQEFMATVTTNAIVMDNVAYASTSNGLVAYANGSTVELTRKIRNQLTGLTNLGLTADYNKHRIIATNVLVYDPETKKLFKYSGSAFRFTSRQFHLPDWRPFTVDRILFVVMHGDTANGTIKYEVKFDDEAWSRTYSCIIPYTADQHTLISETLESARTVRKFQVRISDILGAKYIREVRLDAQSFTLDSYPR